MTLVELVLVMTFFLTLSQTRSWTYNKFIIASDYSIHHHHQHVLEEVDDAEEFCQPNGTTSTRISSTNEVVLFAEVLLLVVTLLLAKVFKWIHKQIKLSEIDKIKQKLIIANRNLDLNGIANDPEDNVQNSLNTYFEIQERLSTMKQTSITLCCKAAILGKVGQIYRELGRYDDSLECKSEAFQVSRQIKELLASKQNGIIERRE